MRRATLLAAVSLLAATAAMQAQDVDAPSAALRTFATSLTGRAVTLKQPIYNVLDSDPENPNVRYGGESVDSRGVTIVSPDRGMFQRYDVGELHVVERDPD